MEPGIPSRGDSGRAPRRRLATSLGLGLALLGTGVGLTDGSAGPFRGLTPGAVAAAAGASASPAPAADLAAPVPSPAPAPTPIPAAALQARLNAIRVAYHVPGVSATIIWPDGRSWTGVNGWADVKLHVPVAPTTAFSVGSVSKTFLAALILQLADEGRLSLDDPVVRWLPTAAAPADATLRELLDHTSGIYDFFSNPAIDPALLADRRRAWTPARALGYMRSPYCPPGTCWHYSNSNYVLLGQVVQRVTGNPVSTELRRRFLGPLRLVRTFVQGAEAARGAVATSYEVLGSGSTIRTVSQGDGTAISPFTSVVTAAGSAGAIAATSRDLAVWARRLYGGAVLRPDTLVAMLDVSHSLGAGSTLPYGLGVEDAWLGGRLTVGHNGRLIGAGATMRYLPDSGFSVAVVTNQDRVSPDVFATALLAIAFPPTPTPSPTPSPQPVPLPSPSGP